jgi:membrane-associated HD superfamily phosphohydrolase
MAYKRDLGTPLAPTFGDPKPKKKKKAKKTVKQRIETFKSNRAIDKSDKAKRKAKIQKQYNEVKSGLKPNRTYSVDVSGERKVKKKVAKIQQKMDKISPEKDARQQKAVDEGRRVETRKNKLLQKQVEAKRVEIGKMKFPAGRLKKTKVPKDKTPNSGSKGNNSKGTLPKGKSKPIRRGLQIFGGQKRKYNNAIRKGTGVGNIKGVTRKRKL